MAARTPMCFQFGLQFENLFKLVCQGGTVDCLLYRTHVGPFDATCAGRRGAGETLGKETTATSAVAGSERDNQEWKNTYKIFNFFGNNV